MSAVLDPVLYEIKNNLVSSFSFVSMGVVTYYVAAEVTWAYHVLRNEKTAILPAVWRALRWNYSRTRIQLALAFNAFLLGEYTTTGWTFVARYIENRGGHATWMAQEPFIYTPILGGVIQVVAAVCLIRILAPDEWGHRGWTTAAMYAVLWSSVLALWR